MKREVTCDKCGSILEYDDKSVWLGNREQEDIYCPICGNIVASVFADQIPIVRVIKKDETE